MIDKLTLQQDNSNAITEELKQKVFNDVVSMIEHKKLEDVIYTIWINYQYRVRNSQKTLKEVEVVDHQGQKSQVSSVMRTIVPLKVMVIIADLPIITKKTRNQEGLHHQVIMPELAVIRSDTTDLIKVITLKA